MKKCNDISKKTRVYDLIPSKTVMKIGEIFKNEAPNRSRAAGYND
jgi:hypothetical protein